MKTGVYLCECGGNISNTVDLEKVQKHIEGREGIEVIRVYGHMCSGAGQKLITEDIEKLGLDRVVVASCSPQFHEKTFKKTMVRGGLNPWVLEIANFREHCSWAHKDKPEDATAKAADILDAALEKVKRDYPLEEKKMQLGDNVLVIGGGIAGIQTSLDLAYAGKHVTLVEKDPTIGGKMARLTKTFPTEDCAACIISPKMAEVAGHPNVDLYTNAEIASLSGHRLHFEAVIEQKPRYISDSLDMDECLICGKCQEVCPVDVPNDWEQGIMNRKAIYVPADLAIPFRYLVDPVNCLHFRDGSCSACAEVCPQKAVDFEQKPKRIERSFDAVVVATGYDIFDGARKPVFGYGEYENVVNALAMERIVDHITENPPPREVGHRVAFIQCVGSRDEQVGNEYCSRVCCMYSTKLASLLKQARPETDIYIFYTDLRAFGKGYEEYYKRAQEMGIKFLRGKPAQIDEDPDTKKVILLVEDTLSRQIIESEFDLVILANGLEPNRATGKIVDELKLATSPDGFLKEAHPKYRPVDTEIEGVFLAGVAQGPKDIPDTVTSASAAASRVIGTLAMKEFAISPTLAFVHPEFCDSCKACLNECPKRAIFMDDETGKAMVNEAMCLGCGACIACCHTEAIDLHGYTNRQLYAQVEAALSSKKDGEIRVVVWADDNCTYRCVDALGVRKMKYPVNTRVFRIPSSSRVQPGLMLHAFACGADAVLIGDCPEKASRFAWSYDMTRKNIESVQNQLASSGVKGDRVFFETFTAGDLARFVEKITAITDQMERETPITSSQRTQFVQKPSGKQETS